MWTLLREVSLRHLRHSPVRTLLVVLGIALGVSMLSAVRATNDSLLAAFEDMVSRVAGRADLTVAGSSGGIPDRLTAQIAEVPGVAHASAVVEVVTRTPDPAQGSLLVLGVDFLGDPFFLPFSQEGEQQVVADPLSFVNDPTAVLVSERLASAQGLRVGSPLTLLTAEGEKTFHVRGLLDDGEGPAASFGGQIVVMFIDALQVSFGRGQLVDRIDVALDEDARVEDVERRLADLVAGTASVERPRGRTQRLVSSLWVFQNGLNVSGIVALWVGMFLIYNAVAVNVAQRRREVGLLRALGVTRGATTLMFCLEALIMSLLGAVIGLGLGQALSEVALANVSDTIHRFVMPIRPPPPEITPRIAVDALIAAVIATLFAAYWPARKSARIHPAEALRSTRSTAIASKVPVFKLAALGVGIILLAILPSAFGGESNGYLASTILLSGVGLLVPLNVTLLRRVLLRGAESGFGIPGRLALDNVERSLGRSAMTVVALMLAVSTSVTIASYAGSFERSILAWADEAFAADAVVTSGSPLLDREHVPFSPALVDKLAGLPGIQATNAVRVFELDLGGRRVTVTAHDSETYFRALAARGMRRTVLDGPDTLAPDALAKKERVLISENLARALSLSAGDRLPIDTPAGVKTFEIYAVVIDYSSDQGWMMMDERHYRAAFDDRQVDAIELFFRPNVDAQALVREVRLRLGGSESMFVSLHDAVREQLREVSQSVFALARAPEVITLLVAVMGVIGTMLAAVIDRLREIGMLRAVGATRGQVVRALMIEAGFLGLCAAVCGTLSGVPQGYIFLKVIGMATSGWNLTYFFPVESAARVFAVVVSIAALAGLFPGMRAARLAIRDALSYE